MLSIESAPLGFVGIASLKLWINYWNDAIIIYFFWNHSHRRIQNFFSGGA